MNLKKKLSPKFIELFRPTFSGISGTKLQIRLITIITKKNHIYWYEMYCT